MKYWYNNQWNELSIKALDSMPVGTIVDYDGQTSDIPTGWETYGTGQIKKTSETTPTMASVVNATNSSTEDSYSCDYINEALEDVYSTTETKTNKVWIDGKPIYRKVALNNVLKSNSSFDSGLTDIDTIVNISFIAKRQSTGLIMYDNMYDSASLKAIVQYNPNNNKFEFWASDSHYLTIIVEYTKTTD